MPTIDPPTIVSKSVLVVNKVFNEIVTLFDSERLL